jgi:hypothetical protein
MGGTSTTAHVRKATTISCRTRWKIDLEELLKEIRSKFQLTLNAHLVRFTVPSGECLNRKPTRLRSSFLLNRSK